MSNPKTGALNAYTTREQVYAAWANIVNNDDLVIYEIRINLAAHTTGKFEPVAFVILKELP